MDHTQARSSNGNPLTTHPDREQRVRERAYQLWETDGKPHGRDIEYWERARELVGTEESIGNGHLPKQRTAPGSLRQNGIEHARVQANAGQIPPQPADPGELKTTPAPKRRARSKPKKPA